MWVYGFVVGVVGVFAAEREVGLVEVEFVECVEYFVFEVFEVF